MQKSLVRKGLVLGIIVLFIGASVVPSIVGEENEYFYATQDIPVQNGGITGTYYRTLETDDYYQIISERESGGKPSRRYSYLEHKWTFELSGSFTTLDLYIEAHHTTNAEGDDFVFAYSTNDASYSDILTVTKTSDDDTYQTMALPNTLSGTVYIRVVDADRSQGNRGIDSISVDHMYILGDFADDTTPPVISDVDSSVNDNTWYNMTPAVIGGPLYPRERHAMAFDSNSGYAITYGGWREDTAEVPRYAQETWGYNYNNNIWYNLTPIIQPSARCDNAMEYNSVADKVILFGGFEYPTVLKDTWTYDFNTNTWTNMTALPSYSEVGGTLIPRRQHDMTYDSKANKVIIFGGEFGNQYLSDTWAYDFTNNTWVNMNPTVIGGPFPLDGWTHAKLAYDDANDVTIMFGGYVDYGDRELVNWTYVYDYNTNTWTNKTPTMNVIGGDLFPRRCHTMCYDSDENKAVLFSGRDETYPWIKDTWTYDAAINTWYKLDPTEIGGNLFPREESAIVYDSINKKSILYSGWISGTDPNRIDDTWAYNIDDLTATITWTTDELADSVVNYGTTIALGSTESETALVLDHEIVLPNILPDQTYYFEVQSTDEAANTALDDNNGNYYTFTTFLGPEISNVASTVNDNTWYNMNPDDGAGIDKRRSFSMAYNSTADSTIIYGGAGGNPEEHCYDTWAYNYNDNTWTDMNPVSNLGVGPYDDRQYSSMVYDSDNDMTILFGGEDGKFKDTWSYNYADNNWTNLTALQSYSEVGGTLTCRGYNKMVYNSSAQRVVMYGGWDGDTFYDETWTYDASTNTWTKMNPTFVGGTKYPRWTYDIAYDSANDKTILFGGLVYTGTFEHSKETWSYDYTNDVWTNLTAADGYGEVGGSLIKRNAMAMTYDSNSERVIMTCGKDADYNKLNDTWAYNSIENKWYKVSPTDIGGSFPLTSGHCMVYDSTAGRAILFGGMGNSNNDFNDTWTLNTNDPTAIVTWITDEPADSVVNYGTTTALGSSESDSALVLDHEIVLTDILPDQTYYFEVQSTDEAGNTAVDDNNGNYYTIFTGQDATPPVISNVQSSGITHNSATITWGTDESSNSRVNYGITTALGDTEFNSGMVTSHSIVLSDLIPETPYYYEVQSTDGEGNTATDDNSGNYYSFTTDSEPNNVMHIHSIDMWYEPVKKKYNIFTEVKIVDAINSPVEGATVYIETMLPNSDIISDNAVTDGNGFVTFHYGPTPKKGTYISTVTNVAKDGWTYNPDDNVETAESLVVP